MTRSQTHLSTSALVAAMAATTIGVGCASTRPDMKPAAPREERVEPLKLQASQRIASEPADVMVLARLSRDEDNRSITLEWWTEDGVGGSHRTSLDGDQAPRHIQCWARNLPAGQYTVTATLTRAHGREIRQSTTLLVVGEGGAAATAMAVGLDRTGGR